MSTEAPTFARRFYKEAYAARVEGGFGVRLDQRALKTPSGAPFIVPTHALAEACALEWQRQDEFIVPSTMPFTKLVFATLDSMAKDRGRSIDYIVAHGETDLCCHRAEAPADLVALQAQRWDPLVAWGERVLGVTLPVVTGIIAARVAEAEIAKLREHADRLDDFLLTGVAQATGLAGSVLIGFALLHGGITPAQAFEAAALDNLFSLEKWGEDAEGRAKLEHQRREFEALSLYMDSLKS